MDIHLHLRTAFLLCTLSLTLSACQGDDGGSGGEGGQGGEPGVGLSCEKDSECDDYIYCNGQERCDDGFCLQGERVECDDGISCTVDRCDEGKSACVSAAPDVDADGFGDASCEDEDGAPLGQDCDDSDELSFPGNTEVCDPEFRDEDCDPTTIGSRDADQDGYLDALCCNEQDDGKMKCGQDCDDHKSNVNPESPEVCDFLDNDCNDEVDEGVALRMYPDRDFDGHGDENGERLETCPGAVGVSALNDDCDDEDPEVFLGQFEICDDKDNNCDPLRLADEVKEQAPWYEDKDEDSYGDPESTPIFSCYRPAGRVLSQNDCSDQDNKVNPNATEICDGKDNDCNGWPDHRVGTNDFEDDDRDGVADAECGGDDCDDTDPRTAGGAQEVCDHIDNDCDGSIDERTVQNIWYIDEDGDGWGVVIGSALASCDPLENRASKFGDCDDGDAATHPDVTEYCDGIDNDCDGLTDEGASVFCKAQNALSTCAQGSCQVYTCTPGFQDADNDYENGCEQAVDPADLLTGISCSLDSQCTDNNLCNGVETCLGTECRLGTPVNCELSGTVVQGDVTISNGIDLKKLQGVQTITGNLNILNTSLVSLVGLESLKLIGGSLNVVGNVKLEKLSGSALSNLEVVGGTVYLQDNPALVAVALPSLTSAGALHLDLGGSAPVSRVEFASLLDIEGTLYVYSNLSSLRNMAFARLARAGAVSLYHQPETNSLRSLDLSGLVRVEESLSIDAPIEADPDHPGLGLDELSLVGQDNDGPVQLCTGSLDQQQNWVHAACDVLTNLVEEHNYTGLASSCGQCEDVSTVADGELYNTGVDAEAVSLADGQIDPHWTVRRSTGEPLTAYVHTEALGFEGYWMRPSATSKFISPFIDTVDPQTGASYIFETEFVIPEEVPVQSLLLSISYASDNSVQGISINGNAVSGVSPGSYSTFTTVIASSVFVTGQNSLEITVLNDSGPAGLRVEFGGDSVPPE